MKTSSQIVDVLVHNKPVRVYAHDNRLYIEAKEGTEYEIRLKNDSSSRVLAVPSVDGLSCLDGKPADDNSTGYIINGRSNYTIKGWRVSNDIVNAFAFGRKEESYAAKTDEPDANVRNVGVIGIKFFSEKAKPLPQIIYRDRPQRRIAPDPYRPYPWSDPTWPIWLGPTYDMTMTGDTSQDTATFSCSASNDSPVRSAQLVTEDSQAAVRGMTRVIDNFNLGTVFTDKEVQDKVQTVEFERDRLLEFVEIFYASREQLEAMGVPINKEAAIAFPSSFKPTGYCRPPKK